ncbi:MAG TPA: hypothetical protein VMV65_05905 [Alphaproteobacteria bacterium]|nr:hypothetical protein [Alphaproteobacteria bacterium]
MKTTLNLTQTIALTGVVSAALAVNIANALISTSSLRWISLYIGIPVAGVALVLMVTLLFARARNA